MPSESTLTTESGKLERSTETTAPIESEKVVANTEIAAPLEYGKVAVYNGGKFIAPKSSLVSELSKSKHKSTLPNKYLHAFLSLLRPGYLSIKDDKPESAGYLLPAHNPDLFIDDISQALIYEGLARIKDWVGAYLDENKTSDSEEYIKFEAEMLGTEKFTLGDIVPQAVRLTLDASQDSQVVKIYDVVKIKLIENQYALGVVSNVSNRSFSVIINIDSSDGYGNYKFNINHPTIEVIDNISSQIREYEVLRNTELQYNSLLEKTLLGDSSGQDDNIKIDLAGFISSLNKSQQNAIRDFIKKKTGITAVQGPPGTGKTLTLLAALSAQHEQNMASGDLKRIIVAAPSNTAVQHILEEATLKAKLNSKFDLPILLILAKTQNKSITKNLFPYTVEGLLNTLINNLDDIIQDLNEEKYSSFRLKYAEYVKFICKYKLNLDPKTSSILVTIQKLIKDNQVNAIALNLSKLKDCFAMTESDAIKFLSSYVPIIFSTINMALTITEQNQGKIFLDESGPVLTSSFAALLKKHNPAKICMFGDDFQLLPLVVSQKAKELGLNYSLLKCFRDAGNILLLDTQYRMPVILAGFISKTFYGGMLNTGFIKPSSSIKYKIPQLPQISFIDLLSPANKLENSDFENKHEVDYVINMLRFLLNIGVEAGNIGVIVPYKKQLGLYKQRLSGSNNKIFNDIDINTVDSFQGKEKKFIIFPCVRKLKVGFLKESNRINMALSRAQEYLFVVGHSDVLKTSPSLKAYMEYTKENGGFYTGEEFSKFMLQNNMLMGEFKASQIIKPKEAIHVAAVLSKTEKPQVAAVPPEKPTSLKIQPTSNSSSISGLSRWQTPITETLKKQEPPIRTEEAGSPSVEPQGAWTKAPSVVEPSVAKIPKKQVPPMHTVNNEAGSPSVELQGAWTKAPSVIGSSMATSSSTMLGKKASVIESASTNSLQAVTSNSAELVNLVRPESRDYKIVISIETREMIERYINALVTKKNGIKPGPLLNQMLEKNGLKLTKDEAAKEDYLERFFECLVQTKIPNICAESAPWREKWNNEEFSILGNINFAAPVTIYDNGAHSSGDEKFKKHDQPFDGTLLFSPGVLLGKKQGTEDTPDKTEVFPEGKFNFDKFYNLYEQRLLPLLVYANDAAKRENRRAFLTIPAIGCGYFAGEFRGQKINNKTLQTYVAEVLEELLSKHLPHLSNIQAVYYDPYEEGHVAAETKIIGNTDFIINPLLNKKGTGKPQLCKPEEYGEKYRDAKFFSIVAYDHFSWPGNDFYAGARKTDDGVKAAATDLMAVITKVLGEYNGQACAYKPLQKGMRDYNHVINKNKNINEIVLTAKGNVVIADKQGNLKRFGKDISQQQAVNRKLILT